MKYYCENCETTVDVTQIELWNCEPLNPDCPFCIGKKMKKIPTHETVAQWEKRRGEKYPDTAPVYVLEDTNAGVTCEYGNNFKLILRSYGDLTKSHGANTLYIVATEAGAPEDDWRPK